MNFKTRFNYNDCPRVGDVVCETPSMTQQQFKDECDINTIVSKYRVTGVLGDPTDTRTPLYGDFSDVKTFMEAQNIIAVAEQQFAELPSEIRKRFDNNPALMLEFLENDNNREEAFKLGLVNKPTLDNDVPSIRTDSNISDPQADS